MTTITITQAVEHSSTNIKAPKTMAGNRTIPIPSWYLPMLENKESNGAYLFPNKQGKVLTGQSTCRAWQSLYRKMHLLAGAKTYRNEIIVHGLPQDLTPYYLRHTYATQLAEKGVPMKTAQYLLGHSDIKMTANIYTHVTDKMIEEARAKINLA